MNTKEFFIIRGVSGSGKSTVAASIVGAENVGTADDYFHPIDNTKNDEYYRLLGIAHKLCFDKVSTLMEDGVPKVAMANTSTRNRDLKQYKKLAELYGYQVFVLVVEKHHDNVNLHGVGEEDLDRMEKDLRNSIKLR